MLPCYSYVTHANLSLYRSWFIHHDEPPRRWRWLAKPKRLDWLQRPVPEDALSRIESGICGEVADDCQNAVVRREVSLVKRMEIVRGNRRK